MEDMVRVRSMSNSMQGILRLEAKRVKDRGFKS